MSDEYTAFNDEEEILASIEEQESEVSSVQIVEPQDMVIKEEAQPEEMKASEMAKKKIAFPTQTIEVNDLVITSLTSDIKKLTNQQKDQKPLVEKFIKSTN